MLTYSLLISVADTFATALKAQQEHGFTTSKSDVHSEMISAKPGQHKERESFVEHYLKALDEKEAKTTEIVTGYNQHITRFVKEYSQSQVNSPDKQTVKLRTLIGKIVDFYESRHHNIIIRDTCVSLLLYYKLDKIVLVS